MKPAWMILALALLACSTKSTTPWVNICADLSWLESVKTTIIQSGAKGEIYLSNYQDERVFEVNGCVECADFISQLQNCEGDTVCQMGGITGLACPGYAPTASERLLYWKN
jgi:hypothetical protein